MEAAGRHGRDRQQGQRPGLDRLAAQSPEGLQDHGDDHRFHAVKDAGKLRQAAETQVGPGDGHDHRHGGDDEADAGDDEPRPAGAEVAEIDGHFGRIGAGDQVHGGQQIEEPLGRDPAAAADQLVFHHGDMGGRPAEGRGPQAEKNECHSRKLACGPAGAASGTPCGGDGLELDSELPMELPPTEEGGKRRGPPVRRYYTRQRLSPASARRRGKRRSRR